MKKTAKKSQPLLFQQRAAQQGRPLRKDDEDTIALVVNIVEAASTYVRKYHRRALGRPPKMGILDTELFHECLRILATAEQGTVGVGVPLAKDIKTIVDGALESVGGPD
jgi:hypothetical protein